MGWALAALHFLFWAAACGLLSWGCPLQSQLVAITPIMANVRVVPRQIALSSYSPQSELHDIMLESNAAVTE